MGVLVIGVAVNGCGSPLDRPFPGIGGTIGSTMGGGGAAGFGQPPCPSVTAGGANVTSGAVCTDADPQLCFEPCGPESKGRKAESCSNGVYLEADCTYDGAQVYSCYSLRTSPDPDCGAEPPRESAACSQLGCTVCNSSAGVMGGYYYDVTGASKRGYCVCDRTTRIWTCASDTEWPCPSQNGCTTVTGTAGSTGGGGSIGAGGTIGAGGSIGAGGGGGSIGAGGGGGSIGAGGSSSRGGSTGHGGAGGAGGTTGTGGTAGTAGTGGGFGQPPCPDMVSKGSACSASDIQFCYNPCGPEKTGVKSETCQTNGTYAEMSGCSFDPSHNYSCYKIPLASNPSCPAGATPQASAVCNVPTCKVCNNDQGVSGGSYLDADGAAHVGYCVCEAANAAGMRVWSCAPDTQWPCPVGSGC